VAIKVETEKIYHIHHIWSDRTTLFVLGYPKIGNMNITYPPIQITDLPPAVEHLGYDFTRAALYLLIPTELLYFSLYFKIKGLKRVYASLAFLAIVAFWMYPLITPIRCGPVQSLQHFASEYSSRLVELRSSND
jgi:hypothetical protein